MKTPHTAPPRDHLVSVGKAIFGDAYKAPLARALKVDLRTLQRWVSDAGDLGWDHGAISDLRDIITDEHMVVDANEIELRTALDDLTIAIKLQQMDKADGGDEMDAWGSY